MTLVLQNIALRVDTEPYLSDINLELHSGSFNVLLGRTQAGKTSLMRVIAGLEKPSAGRVVVDGVDVTDTPVQQRNIAMVYQQFINYPHFTVRDNIASPLKQTQSTRKEIALQVEEIADVLQIKPLLDRYPLELSGGQQQRTAMARALVKNADITLFDEPLANLDYKLREDLRRDIRDLLKQRQSIAVYATTEPQEALTLGGTSILMHEGRILQTGNAADVYLAPASVTAAQLCSEPPYNIAPITIYPDVVTVGASANPIGASRASLHNVSAGEYLLGAAPHILSLERHAATDIELTMHVELAEINGFETHLHVAAEKLSMLVQLSGIHSFILEQTLSVYLPLERALLYTSAGQLIGPPVIDLERL